MGLDPTTPQTHGIDTQILDARDRLVRLRESLERGKPEGRLLSLSITHLEEAVLWLHEYDSGRIGA